MLQVEKERVVNVARGPGCPHAPGGMDPGQGNRDATSSCSSGPLWTPEGALG